MLIENTKISRHKLKGVLFSFSVFRLPIIFGVYNVKSEDPDQTVQVDLRFIFVHIS